MQIFFTKTSHWIYSAFLGGLFKPYNHASFQNVPMQVNRRKSLFQLLFRLSLRPYAGMSISNLPIIVDVPRTLTGFLLSKCWTPSYKRSIPKFGVKHQPNKWISKYQPLAVQLVYMHVCFISCYMFYRHTSGSDMRKRLYIVIAHTIKTIRERWRENCKSKFDTSFRVCTFYGFDVYFSRLLFRRTKNTTSHEVFHSVAVQRALKLYYILMVKVIGQQISASTDLLEEIYSWFTDITFDFSLWALCDPVTWFYS